MAKTDPIVRSCVLASFYRNPERQIIVSRGEYDKAASDLSVGYPAHKVHRALDSLAFNRNPMLHRLDRLPSGNGKVIYRLRQEA